MGGTTDLRDDVMRLTQRLVVEGTKFISAFAAIHQLHHTDTEALGLVLVAQEAGRPMTAGALAAELGLTTGATTAVVDRLERAGHLSRVRHERDRRKVLLQHSPGGRALANDFFDPIKRRSDLVMDQFSPSELDIVRRYLTTVGAAMATYREELAAPSQSQSQSRGQKIHIG